MHCLMAGGGDGGDGGQFDAWWESERPWISISVDEDDGVPMDARKRIMAGAVTAGWL